MPCENCSTQFTVFKRKRICNECKRFYCGHCLVKKNNNVMCSRCIIFTTRPISRVDLLKLKPKDLIFYLQSKHISTTGCVEKEELVNLVLAHINSDATQLPEENKFGSKESTSTENSENCANPFDQIKQTCQNLFNSFTEKISTDFNFEVKNQSSSTLSENISDQPRITREIPTYASSLNKNVSSSIPQSPTSVPISNLNGNHTKVNTTENSSSSSFSSPSSPIISISSISSQSISSQSQAGRANNENHTGVNFSSVPEEECPPAHNSAANKRLLDSIHFDYSGSGCECSDDEIMNKFQLRHHPTKTYQERREKCSPISQTDCTFEDQIPGPSGNFLGSSTISKSSSEKQKNSEDSSGSSFEELGAVGFGSPSDNEHWQFVNKTEASPCAENDIIGDAVEAVAKSNENSENQSFRSHSSIVKLTGNTGCEFSKYPRRLLRRRSDGFIYTQKKSEIDSTIFPQVDEESDVEDSEHTTYNRQRKNCKKCGKNKKNIKAYVAKFKSQLESTHMSEADIKQEVQEFLNYLENRAKSFDCSDSESCGEVNNIIESSAEQSGDSLRRNNNIALQHSYEENDDDGIHIYAHNTEGSLEPPKHDSRFINLGDFKTSSELDELSVKQLKEILMLNRVDYKGCCEKQELLERVHRLWNDLQTSPAVDKLPTDDLCKICMDAPIECVILECGHMATCTNCGKVLSECPICRQYIVRVVRFFRA